MLDVEGVTKRPSIHNLSSHGKYKYGLSARCSAKSYTAQQYNLTNYLQNIIYLSINYKYIVYV